MSICRGCLEVFVGVVGVAGRGSHFLPFPKQITACRKPFFVFFRLGLCKLSILLHLYRLRGIFSFLCLKKKNVESPGPNNFASETGTIALSPIFCPFCNCCDSSPTTAPAFKLPFFCSGNGHNSPFLHIGSSLFWTLSASYSQGWDNPRTPQKKKTAREWTQGPHQREHGTDLMN